MIHFTLRKDPPFSKCQISNDLSGVNITKLTRKKGVFRPRGMNESWDMFERREKKALQEMEEIIFGELVSEDARFEFTEMPVEYDDFRWMKYSEFHVHKHSWTMAISLGDHDIALEKSRHRKHSPCIEKGLIGSLFSLEEEISTFLMNTTDYIRYHSSDGKTISADFWLTRTGMKGRTKILEATPAGEPLIIKPCEEFPNPGEYDVCLSDGRIIGAISWRGDFPQEEYERLYKKLERQGYLKIIGATLNEVIPHGTPKGFPRKALAKIRIEYEYVKALETYEIPADYFQDCANEMNVLAKVDYNRKLEIIEGIRPDRYSMFSEIFSGKGRLNNPDCEVLTRQSLRKFKLDALYMTPLELEAFWNVYRSALHCDRVISDADTCGGLGAGQFLHYSLYNLSFEIEVVEEIDAIERQILVPYLTLYRNLKRI